MPATNPTSKTRQHRERLARARAAERRLVGLAPESVDLICAAWELSLRARGDFATQLYAKLFELSPAAAQLFPGDLTHQRQRLTRTLSESVALLKRPQELVLLLKASGVRHLHYRVRYSHFPLLGQALHATFRHRLGKRYTPAHREAWDLMFDAMTDIMCGAMAATEVERA